MTQLLLDGDLYLYKAAAAAEFECDWGDDLWVLSTNLNQAKDMFRSQVESFKRDLGSDDIVIILSGSQNFRYGLTPNYKSNRKGLRKPLGYKTLLEWLHEEYPKRVFNKPQLEADDYLGILATTPGTDRIIVSEDKDMLTLPAKVYRQEKLTEPTLEEADRFWMLQTLTGDAADGYKGCPGVGPVKAAQILEKPGDTWAKVVKAFAAAGLDEETAFLQASLARILRHENWNGDTQTIVPWDPTISPPK